MLAGQAREAGCEVVVLPIEPDDEARIADAIRDGGQAVRPADRDRGLERRPRRLHGRAGRPARRARRPRRRRPSRPSGRARRDRRDARARRARIPGVGVADVRHLRRAAAGRARGRRGHARARPSARGSRASSPRRSGWTTGFGCGSGESAARSSPRRCRAAPACSPRWSAPTGCSSSRPASRATTPARRSRSSCCAASTQIERTIVAIGSHDMILDLAASQLRASDPNVTLASGNVGSMGGLIALRDGLCHLAGSHLLDPETGAYTLPYVDQILAGREIAVVRLVHREQGLLVAPGNPLGSDRRRGPGATRACATSTASAAPGRACCSTTSSRARGSTRTAIVGYGREEPTHLAVAAAIASDRADCGMGVLAAARAFGLDFVPVTSEPYDLVLERDIARAPGARSVLGAARIAGVQVGGRGSRRLRHRRDGPPHPLTLRRCPRHRSTHSTGCRRQRGGPCRSPACARSARAA